MTPAASRRSWMEPIVRCWILGTIALFAIGLWFLGQQIKAYRDEERLILTGTAVQATITDVNGDSRVGAKFSPGSPATLKFMLNGQAETVTGPLAYDSDDEFVVNGKVITLHVNPNDPAEWTNRSESEPVGRRLIAGVVVVPVAIGAAITAFMLRRRTINIWREAEAYPFSVVETGQSALAPLSHAVRCVAATGKDQSLVTVYLPSRYPKPRQGDVLWLLHPQGKPKAAIAAKAFE